MNTSMVSAKYFGFFNVLRLASIALSISAAEAASTCPPVWQTTQNQSLQERVWAIMESPQFPLELKRPFREVNLAAGRLGFLRSGSQYPSDAYLSYHLTSVADALDQLKHLDHFIETAESLMGAPGLEELRTLAAEIRGARERYLQYNIRGQWISPEQELCLSAQDLADFIDPDYRAHPRYRQHPDTDPLVSNPPVEAIEWTQSDLPQDFRADLESKVAEATREEELLWVDTILEGPYALMGNARFSNVRLLRRGDRWVGLLMEISAPGIFTDDGECEYDRGKEWHNENCPSVTIRSARLYYLPTWTKLSRGEDDVPTAD